MVQVDKPAEGQEEVKLETIGESVVKRKARKLPETLPEKLAEMQVHTAHKQRGHSKWRSAQFLRYCER